MKINVVIKLRARRLVRQQRKQDREWLADNPDIGAVMAERNRRKNEWAKHQVAQIEKDRKR